jgi:FdhD protein
MTIDETQTVAPIERVSVRRLGTGRPTGPQDDLIAAEVPVAIVFNGISHAVMMATPADLEDFALGFALSEGLLPERGTCHGIEVVSTAEGIEVQLEVSASVAARLQERRRTLAGRTGCGLCGIDSLRQLDLAPVPLARPAWLQALQPTTLLLALAKLPARQVLNAASGAHHAAAWMTPAGELIQVMEDVGRHNALDKLLGWRARERLRFDDGGVVMSSRASYELVRKCSRLGVPMLATISAPTTLAVDIAQAAHLRLYGFCRGEQAVQYTD